MRIMGLRSTRRPRITFWRLYYCRPDLVYKIHLGPYIKQEEEQGQSYEPNAANFFATDIKITADKQIFWPPCGNVGGLYPLTVKGTFCGTGKKRFAGTFGTAWEYAADDFTLKLEAGAVQVTVVW